MSQDWKGFVFLNSTAAWLWQNLTSPDAEFRYAEQFEIDLVQAIADIQAVRTYWELWPPQPRVIPPPSNSLIEIIPKAGIYRIGSAVFCLRFTTRCIADEILPRIAACRIAGTHYDHTFVLSETINGVSISLDDVALEVEPLVTSARACLFQEMTRLAEPHRKFSSILHAGVIGNADRCIILAGVSFSGKSTLCVALMHAGFTCYAEDSAALTENYQVAGMPFAISLREGSWPLFPHLDRPRFIPSNLNGSSPTVATGGLIFVKYDSNAETTTLELVETFDALVELDKSGFWIEHTQEAVASFLDWLSRLPIYRLRYSSLPSAVSEVSSLLSALG